MLDYENRVWYGVKVSEHPYYESPGGQKDISFERITRVERDTCALKGSKNYNKRSNVAVWKPVFLEVL